MSNENFENGNPASLVYEDGQPAANLPTTTVDTPGVHEVPATPTVTTGDDPAAMAASQRQADKERLAKVSNADFMAAVFQDVPKGVSAVVCSKSGDPTVGPWLATSAAQVYGCAANTNNYFNNATFKPESDGTYKARKDNAVAYYCLMCDDVGTKVLLDRLIGTKYSWMIETSPGNFQLGYIFSIPLTDAQEFIRLQNAVVAAGYCDPGAAGSVRWARLPVGINGKEKYRSETGKRFQCRLRRWYPEHRFSVNDIVVMLKLDLNAVPAPQAHELPDETSDTVVAQHERESDPASQGQLEKLLAAIDPDCTRQEWLRVLMAVFHETGGSDDGLALVDSWSSKGHKYKGIKDIEVQWRSFKTDVDKPIKVGTLIWMARAAGADTNAIMRNSSTTVAHTSRAQPSATALTPRAPETTPRAPGTVNPLTRFSLKDSLLDLEKQRVEQRLILGPIGLLGQALVIYALANTGKTLIVLYLLIEAIKRGLLDPAKLYYINMDDNSSGLVDKVRLSVEYGFHMLADGHRGFEAKNFRIAMETMVQNNTASGVVVVIDTLKKFVNTMNKEHSAEFTRLVRQFSLKGGTVIALSHANKNPGPDGKIKYTGTTDIVDDFDCAYTLQAISTQPDGHIKVVEFTNIKRRGDVAETAAYSYCTERGLTYSELLTSVQEVDPDQLEPLKQAAELASDAPVVAAIAACIAEGITTKMKMADAGSKRANVSTRVALRVIEKYIGEDPALHYWRYVVGARGAQNYELLVLPSLPNAVQATQPSDGPVTEAVQLPEAVSLPEVVQLPETAQLPESVDMDGSFDVSQMTREQAFDYQISLEHDLY